MLSLREFESKAAPLPSFSLLELQEGENTGSVVLEFAAQPSDTLPALIVPFAHPIHVNSGLSQVDQTTNLDLETGSEDQVTGASKPITTEIFSAQDVNASSGEPYTLISCSV